MTHTYTITGMTCGGSKAAVEKALNQIEAIQNTTVDLERSEATIEMRQEVPLDTLQAVLSDKYRINKSVDKLFSGTHEETSESKLKQLFPLLLIFTYLLTASVLMNIQPWDPQAFMLDFMGLFYIVFSFFKLLDLKNFPASFGMYDPIAKNIPQYGWIYPFLELGLGLMFLFRFSIDIALVATLVILGVTTVGVLKVLLSKRQIQCACLGTALKLPMTQATLIENAVMMVMAVIMLVNTMVL
jgi:copper chaperone CopZ